MIELIDGRLLLYGPYWNANGFEVAIAAVITPEVDWAAYIGGNTREAGNGVSQKEGLNDGFYCGHIQMTRTKIEWCDYSWNPIKGLCPVECWYCYAKAIYKRFKLDPDLVLNNYELLCDWPRKPSRIFVCSTMELFHPRIHNYWKDWIFEEINEHPQHTFIILTKMPERIDRPMPDNIWLWVSVEGVEEKRRIDELFKHEASVRFVSAEPLLADHADPLAGSIIDRNLNWFIIGRLTGHGKNYDPTKIHLAEIVRECAAKHIPLYMKNNLADIWGKPLIQEYPKCP